MQRWTTEGTTHAITTSANRTSDKDRRTEQAARRWRALAAQAGGSGQWVLRVTVNGRRREMGLGSLDVVSLREARKAAEKWRAVVASGHDPIKVRDAERRAAAKVTGAAPGWLYYWRANDVTRRALVPMILLSWQNGYLRYGTQNCPRRLGRESGELSRGFVKHGSVPVNR